MSDYFDRYYVRYESEYLEHDVEGKFMLYEDHLAIVEKLKAEAEEEWAKGYLAGLNGTD